MQKIVLYAYDRQNLGDDLFVRYLASRYSDVKFKLWSTKDNKETFQTSPNICVIDQQSNFIRFMQKLRPSFLARYKKFLEDRCAAIVYIGGSIFIEYDSWRAVSNWWNYEADNHNLYILGANFGPFSTPEYRDTMNLVFQKAQDVCFRDQYSKDLFSINDRVRYAPDILFGASFPKTGVASKKITISVIDCKRDDRNDQSLKDHADDYEHGLIQYVTVLVRQGYLPVLASFCKAEGDEDAIERIIAEVDSETRKGCCSVYYTGQNQDELLQLIASSAYIVASRFHAAILGMAAGRPVLPLIYSDKLLNVLMDMNYSGKYLDIRTEEDYDSDMMMENLNRNYVPDIENLKKDSAEHFRKLDELLFNRKKNEI